MSSFAKIKSIAFGKPSSYEGLSLSTEEFDLLTIKKD
jgi:hypothetical protein